MDEPEKLLPIFPLAVVLVPGELLPLHVFEERYKAMMRDVLEGERRFGLSYVSRAEVGVDTPPTAGSVGCEAQVTAVVPLAEGKLNMLSVGTSRYVIRGYEQYEPYLIARVQPFSDDPDDDPDLEPLADDVRSLFLRLAAAAQALSSETDQTTPELDVPPEALSFLVAGNVALDDATKQEMLEGTDTRLRLEQIAARLRDLVGTYEYRAEMQSRAKTNGHGKKLPEIDEDEDEDEE
jgi:ATP-dependent Lon protease